jgi:hypothetical protein
MISSTTAEARWEDSRQWHSILGDGTDEQVNCACNVPSQVVEQCVVTAKKDETERTAASRVGERMASASGVRD